MLTLISSLIFKLLSSFLNTYKSLILLKLFFL